jgi:hypothetical protein
VNWKSRGPLSRPAEAAPTATAAMMVGEGVGVAVEEAVWDRDGLMEAV